MGATNIWSKTLTADTLSVSASQNVLRISILARQGPVTILGTSVFNGVASDTVTFATGQGVTLTSASTQNPIDGITIDASAGGAIADIVLSYQ
jgi:hypothetical protein